MSYLSRIKYRLFSSSLSLCVAIASLCASCSSVDRTEREKVYQNNEKREAIYRLEGEHLFVEGPHNHCPPPSYPWENYALESLPRITAEHFRCKGSESNPPKKVRGAQEVLDCGGIDKHALPMRGEQEFIYKILLQILNDIQKKSGKRVVITTGHRCPTHNHYADPSSGASKHQIGAEVDFYVEQFEERPLEIVTWVIDFYRRQGDPDYNKFFQLPPSNFRKQPSWYNKEITLRIYEKEEGRDFDNRHPYPYITIEVRFDRDTGEAVQYDRSKI